MENQTQGRKTAATQPFAPSRGWRVWIGVTFWMLLTLSVSLTSQPPGTKWLIALSRQFPAPPTALRTMQAVLHLALYGVGAILAAAAIRTMRPSIPSTRLFFLTVAAIMSIGIAIEFLQDYVPNRRADLWDLSGDLAGAVLFLALGRLGRRGPFRHSGAR